MNQLDYQNLLEEYEAWAFNTPNSVQRKDAKEVLEFIERETLPVWVLKEISSITKQCYKKDLSQALATGNHIPPSYIPILEKIIALTKQKLVG